MSTLTLGVYQLSLANEYIKKHLNEDDEFCIEVNGEYPGILRAKLNSRFRSGKKHNLWIQYDNRLENHHAITGHYCTCWAGARTVGLCSHLTCVCTKYSYTFYVKNENVLFYNVFYYVYTGALVYGLQKTSANQQKNQKTMIFS